MRQFEAETNHREGAAAAVADVVDERFVGELFDLLWGQERTATPTVADYAYEQLWKRVILLGGSEEQRLSDVTLAEQLGVSRTPVRQALERLVQEGLVRADPRRGYWTRTFTAQDIHEIYDLREALEVLALRLAAPHLKREELQAQLDELEAIRAELTSNPFLRFLKVDLLFHLLITRASRNGRLIHCLSELRSQLCMFQMRDSFYPRRIEIALNDHEQILRALLAGKLDEAAALLAAHIRHSKEGVLADIFAEESHLPS
ncbi:GntR family transcriptional regulator [Thermogemmatispora carboxidivorans]|uniref:GntR family transcriptional regulator n=1 Tax=Thermogemmatispora carboxidivorans TaxID=1382306 RepID=UPI00069A3F34|nr:GntR family transcriptional regulator [Thermogemmatispora carboxidivorans]